MSMLEKAKASAEEELALLQQELKSRRRKEYMLREEADMLARQVEGLVHGEQER